jgi:hypothetical protein
MATSADALASKTEAELLFISQHPEKHSPEVVAAAERELQQRLDAVNSSYNAASSSRMGPLFIGLALLLLVGVGVFWYQRQSLESVAPHFTPTGPAAARRARGTWAYYGALPAPNAPLLAS